MSVRTALAVLAFLASAPDVRAAESAARAAFAADLDECAAALKTLDRHIPAGERVSRCVPTLVDYKAIETRGRITGAMRPDGSILPVSGVDGKTPRERALALFSRLEERLGAEALRPKDPSLFTMSYDAPTARVQSWKFARAQAKRHAGAPRAPAAAASRLEVLWRRAGALADPNLPWITAEMAQAAAKGPRGPAAPEAWALLAERLDPASHADLLPLSPQAMIILAEALAPVPPGFVPPVPSTTAWFEPVDAAAAGFAFPAAECPFEDTGVDQMPGGMAVLDYDLDGKADLLLCAPGQARLMRNLGSFRFSDETKAAGLTGAVCRNGASSADYDNDGRPDLLLLHGKGDRDRLYRNAEGRFRDVTAEMGLSTGPAQSVSAVWLDYDRDGRLDLYLVEYGDLMFERDPRPDLEPDGLPNRLYRNAGARFEDATAAAGVGDAAWGLGAAAFDYDGDGDDDLFVVNDFGRSSLFRNDGGRFADVSSAAGVGFAGNGMGVSVADYDRDGRPDLFVTYIGDERPAFDPLFPAAAPAIRTRSNSEIFPIVQRNRLLRNAGGGAFVDASASALEETPTGWGWNGFFLDAGNRGWLDLYLVNGWWAYRPFYDRETKVFWRWEPEAGRFAERSRESGASFPGNSRVSAAADLDGDGCLDLVAAGFHPLRLFRGRCPRENHWLEVRLEGSRSNRDGIGARVTATAGGVARVVEIGPQGGGFQNSLERVARFGLGEEDAAELSILWPSGATQTLRAAADRRVVVREAP